MKSTHENLSRNCGISLALGGVTTLIVNVIFTPMLPTGDSVEVAASHAFLLRQCFSALAAIFLLIGIFGVYVRQADRAGKFGLASFLIALVGCVMLLAQEWNQIFYIRDLAIRAPETMLALEETMALPDIGSMIAFSFFTVGWILFAISTIVTKVYNTKGPILVLVGFFAAPILGAMFPSMWGMIVGNAILAAGWIWVGLERYKAK